MIHDDSGVKPGKLNGGFLGAIQLTFIVCSTSGRPGKKEGRARKNLLDPY
jgi:hypothetical protein